MISVHYFLLIFLRESDNSPFLATHRYSLIRFVFWMTLWNILMEMKSNPASRMFSIAQDRVEYIWYMIHCARGCTSSTRATTITLWNYIPVQWISLKNPHPPLSRSKYPLRLSITIFRSLRRQISVSDVVSSKSEYLGYMAEDGGIGGW